jgi:hypothetical protein
LASPERLPTRWEYEVTGESPSFEPNVISGQPSSINRHRRSILMAKINAHDLPTLRAAIAAVKPDNSTVHRNCQDYVSEILGKLEDECVVDGDDGDFALAKRLVKQHYGPQL